MKQLTCEMCGSTDLLKENGVFICQSCGTKYSVEEAKKMMVEGTVEIAGIVKVDNSDKLNNLYKLARRAKNENNCKNAANYYDLILLEDPNSWEASFYHVYFRAMESTIAQINSAGQSISNCLGTVLNLINEYADINEQEDAVNEVASRCTLISDILYNAAKNHFNEIDETIRKNYIQEMVYNCMAARDILYSLGDNISSIFPDNVNLEKTVISAWKDGIIKHGGLLQYLDQKEANKDIMDIYACQIKLYEPSYKIPVFINDGFVGCYIATAVYGSYNCPQVLILRRYRDAKLANNILGRIFIRAYYAISPTLVELFSDKAWFYCIWRSILDYKIKKLLKCGFGDTLYEEHPHL